MAKITVTEVSQNKTTEIVTITGKQEEYIVFNGTYFPAGTEDGVIAALSTAMQERKRIRIFLGNTEKGQLDCGTVWPEVYDTMGYVGRTMGIVKSPILLRSNRSTGGGIILTRNILMVKETASGEVLYKHPRCILPSIVVRDSKLYLCPDGKQLHLQMDSPESARKAAEDMTKRSTDGTVYCIDFDPCYIMKMKPEKEPIHDYSQVKDGEKKARRMADFLMGLRNNY